MTLTFKFEDVATHSSDEIVFYQKRSKELQNVIETEVKKHFKDSKGPVVIAGKWSAENGDFVEVNLLAEDFVRDLEKAKSIMYSEQKHFIEDFISDVQEYCSYGGIIVSVRG